MFGAPRNTSQRAHFRRFVPTFRNRDRWDAKQPLVQYERFFFCVLLFFEQPLDQFCKRFGKRQENQRQEQIINGMDQRDSPRGDHGIGKRKPSESVCDQEDGQAEQRAEHLDQKVRHRHALRARIRSDTGDQ